MISSSDRRLVGFAETVQGLVESAAAPTATDVVGLSNPSAADLALWQAALRELPLTRRRAIAHALVKSAEDSFQVNYKPLFVSLLDDADGEVRSAGIDGLWESEDLHLMDRFVDMAAHDADADVRGHAATALGNFLRLAELEDVPPSRAAPALAVVLDRAQDESEEVDVRRRAIASAGFADRPEVRLIIEDALASDEGEIVAGALRAIGNSADDEWGPQLAEWLEHDDPGLRREAIWAAGELGWRPAVAQLAQLSDTDDRASLAAIIRALGEIGGKNAARVLERLGPLVEDDEELVEIYEDALATLALNEGTIDLDIFSPGAGAKGAGNGGSDSAEGGNDFGDEDLLADIDWLADDETDLFALAEVDDPDDLDDLDDGDELEAIGGFEELRDLDELVDADDLDDTDVDEDDYLMVDLGKVEWPDAGDDVPADLRDWLSALDEEEDESST